MSLALIGEIVACGGIVTGVICGIVACGIATCALSSMFGAEPLFDCRPIGAGEIIEGAAVRDRGLGAVLHRRLRRRRRL